MPHTFSSLSRRRALATSALLATLGMAYRRRALAAGGALNILNCNVAWSSGLEGPVADAYEAKTGTSITAEPTPYDSLYQKILIELSQGSSTYDLVTSDLLWMRQPINNGWAAVLEEIKASDPSLPEMFYENLGASVAPLHARRRPELWAADVDVDAGVHLSEGSVREGRHRESAEQLGGIPCCREEASYLRHGGRAASRRRPGRLRFGRLSLAADGHDQAGAVR